MRKYTLLNRMASIAACVGMLLTGVSSAFEGTRAPIAKDVEISARGTLQGQVLTPAGTPIANAPVRLAWQGTPVAETKTTAEDVGANHDDEERGLNSCGSGAKQAHDRI